MLVIGSLPVKKRRVYVRREARDSRIFVQEWRYRRADNSRVMAMPHWLTESRLTLRWRLHRRTRTSAMLRLFAFARVDQGAYP